MCLFFFFKQKTAYELRISDWSSDVCSSDLTAQLQRGKPQPFLEYLGGIRRHRPCSHPADILMMRHGAAERNEFALAEYRHHDTDIGKMCPAKIGIVHYIDVDIAHSIQWKQIGRASGRERVCQYD